MTDLSAITAPPVDTSAASTYTDLNGLSSLKSDPNSPQAINAVAQQVEALFLQMMLKSMRDAGSAQGDDSNEMGMYQDMFDKQVALSISQHADLGIAKLLKRQTSLKNAPVAAGGGNVVPPLSASQFVEQVMPSIRRAAGALGVDPAGILAQAALETGWGQRMPRNADGSPSFNFFGIKAGDEWHGATAAADSIEVIDGVATPRRSTFRAYGSAAESVEDFARLLKSSPRYKEALAAGADVRAYVASIGKSGYASDPDYANKLNQILGSGTLQAALAERTAAL